MSATLTRRALILIVAVGACSPQRDDRADSARVPIAGNRLADSLAIDCPATGQPGSVLVARPDPNEEESLVSFALLGGGAGPGVTLCRGVLYADVAALLKLMGEHAIVTGGNGKAIFDSSATDIPAYRHEGDLYVAIAPFARRRRALWVPSEDHPQDGTLWPQRTLLHLKAGGRTSGVWQSAVREGLVRD